MSVIVINGNELEFDAYDVDVVERTDDAREHLSNEISEINSDSNMRSVEKLRAMCDATRAFFDCIFGDGTGDKIFGDKDNVKTCLDAVGAVNASADEQQKAFNDTYVNKYESSAQNRPQNRAQRRTQFRSVRHE